jgi:hypothetical protein
VLALAAECFLLLEDDAVGMAAVSSGSARKRKLGSASDLLRVRRRLWRCPRSSAALSAARLLSQGDGGEAPSAAAVGMVVVVVVVVVVAAAAVVPERLMCVCVCCVCFCGWGGETAVVVGGWRCERVRLGRGEVAGKAASLAVDVTSTWCDLRLLRW